VDGGWVDGGWVDGGWVDGGWVDGGDDPCGAAGTVAGAEGRDPWAGGGATTTALGRLDR
jgi:hypothetical protein